VSATVFDGGPARELLYWRARAEALETVTTDLRRRLLALARVVPSDLLELVVSGQGGTELPPLDLFEGWEETTALTPSDVKTELTLLWARLAPPGRG
jgi:hypothetical protein